MSTAAHAIDELAEFAEPERGEGGARRARAGAVLQPRADPLVARRLCRRHRVPCPSRAPLRHVGIYGYRAGFLRAVPATGAGADRATEALEQLRAMWHGHRIAVHVTAGAPGVGVDTPEDLERVRALWRAGRA